MLWNLFVFSPYVCIVLTFIFKSVPKMSLYYTTTVVYCLHLFELVLLLIIVLTGVRNVVSKQVSVKVGGSSTCVYGLCEEGYIMLSSCSYTVAQSWSADGTFSHPRYHHKSLNVGAQWSLVTFSLSTAHSLTLSMWEKEYRIYGQIMYVEYELLT